MDEVSMHDSTMKSSRRQFLARTAAATGLTAGVTALGAGVWATALADRRIDRLVDRRIFGPLGPPDALGLRLPPGFSARLIARSGDLVASTDYVWHTFPDGGGVVARDDGGWIYVSNSEVPFGRGGAGCVSFTPDGEVDDAYSILSETTTNCAGGMTPWATWLSCEEFSSGKVYECNPFAPGSGIVRPLLGTFAHEAATVDAVRGAVYLTEDQPDGRLYRFTPDVPGVLTAGRLHAASVATPPATMQTGDIASVTWVPTATDRPDRSSLTSPFAGGEGAWVDGDRLLFTTKRDKRVWALDLVDSNLTVLHDAVAVPTTSLNSVDNLVVHPVSGDIFVAEDGGNMELSVLREFGDRGLAIGACLQIVGQDDSEVTGPAFSPDGRRLYVSSQRGVDLRGLTYEITGPFVTESVPVGPLRPAKRMGATFTG
jgi:uncharacterized protein